MAKCTCQIALDQVIDMIDSGCEDIPRVASNWFDDVRGSQDVACDPGEHYNALVLLDRLRPK